MINYALKEEEYNVLANRKKLPKKSYSIKEGDRIFISSHCKIDKGDFIKYIDDKFDDVYLSPEIENCNVVLINDDSDLYITNIGYQYEEMSFRNEEEWMLFISKSNQKLNGHDNKKDKKDLTIKDAYKSFEDNQKDSHIDFNSATKVYYITILDHNHTVNSIVNYIEGSITMVYENNFIKITSDKVETVYNFSNEDIIHFLNGSNKNNWDIAITHILNNYELEDIVKLIIPYYYSEKMNGNAKNLLYKKVLLQTKKIKDVIIEPRKAAFSHYRHVKENIIQIQRKTKINIDNEEFLKSYINEK